MSRILSTVLLAALPLGAQAHPHIFVDTALTLVTDDAGRPLGVEVTWDYDEFYSLLMFEDMGLDGDYDGTLTEAELRQLDGFDMNWIEGYAGDLYVTGPAGPVALGAPEPRGTSVTKGRIETRHFRPFTTPAPEELVLRAYDPTYYTAYDLVGGVHVPAGCTADIAEPDLDAAQARVETELAGRSPDIEDFPEVGEAFAQTVTVTCGAGE